MPIVPEQEYDSSRKIGHASVDHKQKLLKQPEELCQEHGSVLSLRIRNVDYWMINRTRFKDFIRNNDMPHQDGRLTALATVWLS